MTSTKMLFDDLEAAKRNREMIETMRQREAEKDKSLEFRPSHHKKIGKPIKSAGRVE